MGKKESNPLPPANAVKQPQPKPPKKVVTGKTLELEVKPCGPGSYETK